MRFCAAHNEFREACPLALGGKGLFIICLEVQSAAERLPQYGCPINSRKDNRESEQGSLVVVSTYEGLRT